MSTAAAAHATWLDWDGRRLHWRHAAGPETNTHVELCIDGIVFERCAAHGEFVREFACSPSGSAELEFSVRSSAGDVLSAPWRVVHGCAAAVAEDQWRGAVRAMRPLADTPLPPASLQAPPAAIVVPIFNAAELAQQCIDAVLRWSGDARLILIDDASTQAGVAALLAGYADRPGIAMRSNPDNLGYTHSCNIGIALAGAADVVLLNSDTQVGPRWLERLRLSAYADAAIGTVTAVSDNAGAFSVPELEQYCPIPARWTLEQAQRALLQHAGSCLPELPTGNGFCMYIKRALIERVGMLDAQAFPSGYGEENDLCQRAVRAGFRHVIAGDVLVRHARSASFGDARRAALGAQGMAVLRERYPDYEAQVGATLHGFARRVLDYRVRRIYADSDGFYSIQPPRPRLLLAGGDAGATPLAEFESFRLVESASRWQLHHQGVGALVLDEAATGDAQALGAWLARYAIEAVHVQASLPGDAAIRQAAARAAVPIVDARDRAQLVAFGGGVP